MGILIVDDSEDQLLLLERLLRNAGHRNIILADSAIKALDMLKNSSASLDIDLVLMDVNMPGMDGIEACYKIKEDERLKDIPVIIITASNEIVKLQSAFSAGAVDYITKPVRVSKVLSDALKRPADLIARYGGEEFAAVLPETDIKGAVALAEAMRSDVESLMIPHAGSHVADHVTISLGAASTVPERNSSPSRLIAEADKALYEAKDTGRNRVRTGWDRDIISMGGSL